MVTSYDASKSNREEEEKMKRTTEKIRKFKFRKNTATPSMLAHYQPNHEMNKTFNEILNLPQYQFKNRRMMELVGREIRKEGLKIMSNRQPTSQQQNEEGLLGNCQKNLSQMQKKRMLLSEDNHNSSSSVAAIPEAYL